MSPATNLNSSQVTVYKDAREELRALNQEFVELGQKSLALALQLGERLTEQRKKFPPRGGWIEFLKDVGIPQGSSWHYMNIWSKRSILLRHSDITLADALRIIRPPKKRGSAVRVLKDQRERNIPVKVPIDKAVMNMFEGFIMEVMLQHTNLDRDAVIEIVRHAINP